eukprot:Skav201433  [mRNA]  locus=scaffold201:334612:346103:- [translate_table: standard]
MLAEDPNPVLPLGTGSQGTQMAIGDDDERQVGQSPDGTLSQFIRSPGSHNQVVPVNPFRVPPGGDPSSIGPVGTPEGANFVQQNNLKQEYHQHQYQTNVRQELNVSLDPLLVAQAHHVVEQNRASVISQAQEALNQSRDQLREEANQAVIQAQEAAKAEALTYVHRVEAEARQNASNAQTEIEQLRKRAAETSTELRNRAKAEVALVEAEANRRIATLEGRISELTHERDNLAQMVQGMSNNQDGFENTVQSLMEEKETLVNRVQSLMINQDVLEGDIRSLMGEREMLTKRVQMLIDEKQDTIQKAQRMLDERDRLISELTGRVQDQNETITNLRNTIGIIQGSAMKPPVQSIVGAGNGAGSSKGVPKNEVKSKQSVETAIQEMKTMLVKLEQRVSRSPSAAHHVVEQNRASVISQAQEALNQSRDQLREEANQAVIQAQEAAKAEALTYVHRVEAEARQNASNAQTEIEQLRKRAAETSTELRNRAKAEVALVEAEANRRIATLEGRISELTHERDNLAQMVQGMSNNQGSFENTVQSLMEEKETLTKRVQSLMINQDVLEGDIRSLMGEREMLTKRVQMLIDEKQDTIQKAQRMLDERDTLISELTGRLQTLNSNRSTAMRQPALAIVEAGNGAGSSKGVPKNEVKSKQSVETAIQEMKTMLVKLEQRVSRSPSAVSHSHKSNSSSSSSSKPKGGGGSPGNSSGGGSNGSPRSSNGSSSSDDDEDPYKFEKKYMRVKGYDAMKFPMIPKNAAEARGYRNSIYSAVCKLAKKDESKIFAWISVCNRATQASEIVPGQFPILDRIIGHKLLESSRGTRFSLDFQTVQEAYQKRGRQPSGRLLLWTVFQKFKLDKDRGASLSQHHLLALKLEGTSIKSLIDFKSKFDYIAGSLEQADMPSDQALRSLLFENLKSHPKLTLAIDKFREARVGSSKRTWNWLYQKMEEAIEIDQLDENTGHVEKALQSSGGHKVNANAAKTDDAKPDKPKKEKPTKTKEDKPKKEAKEKTEKPKKEKETSEAADASVAAAPGQSKGKSKGKGTEKPSASSSAKPSKEDKKKDPCMYFAYSACTKGDKCPYLHDKNNLYKGPKPKALTTSHAGAAQIVSGAVAATTILGTQGASSLSAPCRHVMEEECCSTRSREDGSDLGAVQGSDLGAVQNGTWREFIEESNVVKLGRRCKPTKKDQKGKMFSCPRMFEKAIKCFAAIAAVCEPSSYHQEFLVDSGAGRNLISSKDMPEPWNHYVAEAPEQLKFATGGGLRPSTKAIRLKGSLSGEGVFYTLRDCPAALSLGQQVNEQGAVSVGEKPPPAPPESDVPPGEVLTRDVDERLLEGDPEIGSDYTPSLAEDVPKEDPATGGELVLASDPSHKDPPSSDDEVEEISANHQLTHYPKSRSCEVCMRAKMTSRYHRKRGDPDPEEAPPLHYGHQIRVDHLIMGSDLQKGSEGEQACLVCFDEYSGCYQAFPQTQRTTENNIACLRKFGGTKAHGKALCVVKSDAAKELTEAVKALDWLPDEAIPNDAFHNAKLESNIRRLKEGVRACHLAAGFSHELWPRSMEYFCAAKARDEGGSGELPKIALPFEEGAPKTPARVRRTYITLERAIKFGKTVGCKGCERIAEGVKHSDACHERFRLLLEEESKKAKTEAEEKKKLLALEDKPKIPSELSRGPELPDFENLMEAVHESDEAKRKARGLPAGAAKAKTSTDAENLGDYWEYDQAKGAWCPASSEKLSMHLARLLPPGCTSWDPVKLPLEGP